MEELTREDLRPLFKKFRDKYERSLCSHCPILYITKLSPYPCYKICGKVWPELVRFDSHCRCPCAAFGFEEAAIKLDKFIKEGRFAKLKKLIKRK
jgi:hypothetical protein